jgi:AcrR family transcriptional regulator
MGNSYSETHEDILNSAKKNFLEKGFERSNLREICKGANVTTGAFYRHFNDKESVFIELVEDVIKELESSYYESEDEIYNLMDKDKIDKIWDLTSDSVQYFIELIYNHHDAFKLLLMSADGTKYSHFLHDIATVETKQTFRFINYLKELGYNVKEISEDEVHMLIQAYFSAVFEIVMHDYSREEAIKYSKVIIDFNKQGWKSIFGI